MSNNGAPLKDFDYVEFMRGNYVFPEIKKDTSIKNKPKLVKVASRVHCSSSFKSRKAFSLRKRDLTKIKCYAIYHVALQEGKLVRPLKCSRCGRTKKVIGHHKNYSRPLLVIWLCHRCHAYIHDKTGMLKVEH